MFMCACTRLRELIYTNWQNTGAGLLGGSRNFISNPVTLILRVHSLQSNSEKPVYLIDQDPLPTPTYWLSGPHGTVQGKKTKTKTSHFPELTISPN